MSQSDRMDLEKELEGLFNSKWRGQDLKKELVDLCKSAVNFERQRMIEKFRPVVQALEKHDDCGEYQVSRAKALSDFQELLKEAGQ